MLKVFPKMGSDCALHTSSYSDRLYFGYQDSVYFFREFVDPSQEEAKTCLDRVVSCNIIPGCRLKISKTTEE